MGACIDLLKGQELTCGDFHNKYYQNIVLVNRKDVDNYNIKSSHSLNRITFNLKAGKSGFLFRASENASVLSASFSKKEVNGIPMYSHSVQMPVIGVDEEAKTLLKQLDLSDCFAGIQFKDGTVEIYGFNYGLKTSDYSYEGQSSLGGGTIQLESRYEEYDPPYIYKASVLRNEGPNDNFSEDDFNNLFSGIVEIFSGDFNNDFNNDFFIAIP